MGELMMKEFEQAYTAESNDHLLQLLDPSNAGKVRQDEVNILVEKLETAVKRKNYQEVTDLSAELIGIEPGNVNFWLLLVEALIYNKSPELALKILANARFLFPMNPQIYLLKAKCHILYCEETDCIEALNKVKELDSSVLDTLPQDHQLYFFTKHLN